MSAVLHMRESQGTDAVLDALARSAAAVAECPIGAVALAQGGQMRFKGRQGMALDAVPLETSFCRHTMQAQALFEVPDTHASSDFSAHPLVTDGPRLRYYAGFPLMATGRACGALCVGDTQPHRMSQQARKALQQLADMAVQWLHSRRLLAQCLGQLGHELRTPLNAVAGFAQLILRDKDSALSPRAQEWMAHVQRSGWHMSGLMEDLLRFARLDLDTAAPQLQALPLQPVIEQAMAMVQPQAEQSSVLLHHMADEQHAWVMGNEQALRQVLLNLLSNAVKFNRRHGIARVGVKTMTHAVQVSVIDQGPGLTREQMDRLFLPFSRVGTDRSVEGHGLGLSIARALAERMGGSLGVSSTPGEGSVFTLRLQPASV